MYFDPQKISDGSVRTTRMIYIALAMSVTMFAAVCLFLYFSKKQEYDPSLITTDQSDSFFLTVFILFTLAAYVNLFIFPRSMFNKRLSDKKSFLTKNNEFDINAAVGLLRTYSIIRLALMEGTAFFGLVFLILHIQNYKIYTAPVYWVFIIPAVIMVIYIITNLPTRERITNDIQEKIIVKLQENN